MYCEEEEVCLLLRCKLSCVLNIAGINFRNRPTANDIQPNTLIINGPIEETSGATFYSINNNISSYTAQIHNVSRHLRTHVLVLLITRKEMLSRPSLSRVLYDPLNDRNTSYTTNFLSDWLNTHH